MNTQNRHLSILGKSEKGFSLIEVIVALAVLTIGVLAVNAMQTVAVRGNMTASGITVSSNWAADRIEQIYGADYDADDLKDTHGDGTGGLGNNTPTVDTDPTTADHTWISPDGNYSILWNVAEESPMDNIKTIQIIVNRTERGTQHSVTLRYKKALYM